MDGYDVSWLPFVFVIVITVMAVIGNVCVLLVYSCRWRSTNDTKIYIVVLAVLDLVCVLLSAPRELLYTITETANSTCLIEDSHLTQGLCKLTVFVTSQFNTASAFILIVIAVSRWVKATRKDFEVTGRSKFKAVVYSFSTARGAKLASVVTFCACLLLNWPMLVLYGSVDPSMVGRRGLGSFNPTVTNNSTVFDSKPEKTTTSTCFQTCLHSVRPGVMKYLMAFFAFQCATFVATAIALVGIYGAILRRLCEKGSNRSPQCTHVHHNTTSTDVSDYNIFVNSVSTNSYAADETAPGNNPLIILTNSSDRSLISDDNSTGEEIGIRHGFTDKALTSGASQTVVNNNGITDRPNSDGLSFTSADNFSDLNGKDSENGAVKANPFVQARLKPLRGSRMRRGSADDNEILMDTPPPVSYSAKADAVSIPANVRGCHSRKEKSHGAERLSTLSTASFQFKKTGNRARLTTLLFFLVTAVYIVSYLPYFAAILAQHVGEASQRNKRDPGVQVALKSFLIANAVNPFVYGLCNPYFRKQLWKLLVCRRDII